MSDLAGKTIVVTGAGGGIGLAAVSKFLTCGANVVATDLAGTGVQAAGEMGERAVSMVADVASASDWDDVRSFAVESFGAVHGLVNNAGIEGAIVPLTEYPEEMFDRVMAINVRGVFLGMQTFAPLMAEAGGGSIVNISSVAGLGGASNLSAYSASKHAVIGLTKSAALELAADGIRCNAICPSPIQTRMMRSLEESMKTDGVDLEAMQAIVAANIPMGRYGEPAEVADLMAFLLSDESQFLSGAAIPIDGAMKAR
jgi:NAD(P)-dependent dehydrogenase (short-subunit alcohol dehydrogenase family)